MRVNRPTIRSFPCHSDSVVTFTAPTPRKAQNRLEFCIGRDTAFQAEERAFSPGEREHPLTRP